MDFYFSPLACSMATRIALAEAGGTFNLIEIDPDHKKVLACEPAPASPPPSASKSRCSAPKSHIGRRHSRARRRGAAPPPPSPAPTPSERGADPKRMPNFRQ